MRHAALAFTVFGLVLAGPMSEAISADALPEGDVEAGRAVAAACSGCHGAAGISPEPQIPHIAGQHAGYIFQAMMAYQSGERKASVMQASAAGLSYEDTVNVATYFASLRPFKYDAPGATSTVSDEADPFAAIKEVTVECDSCHGDNGNSSEPGTPSLAGQHAQYLILALKAYKDGSRDDETMQAFAEPNGAAAVEDIAFFYATTQPKRATTPVLGDPFAGRAIAEACANCHGPDGNTKDPKTPRLAGLDAAYLEAALKAYKDGRRSHAAMRDAVLPLRDTDIKNLSAFYATKHPKALPVRKPLTIGQWVEKCGRCHGVDGNSTDWRFPILAGQSEAYLVKALKLYHGRERANSMMHAMSFPMGESDIRKLAAFYASRIER